VAVPLSNLGALTLFVDDLEPAKRFYRDVFGLETLFEDDNSTAFNLGNTTLNLLRDAAAGSLIGPATVAPREAGSRLQLTIWVDDADAVCARLAEHGVELVNGPVDREWGLRTAAFADPAGHVWEIAQALSRD